MVLLLPGACDMWGLGKTCFSLGSGFITDLPQSGDRPDSSSKLCCVSCQLGLWSNDHVTRLHKTQGGPPVCQALFRLIGVCLL